LSCKKMHRTPSEGTNLLRIDSERTFGFTVLTNINFDLLLCVLIERSQYSTALPAIKLDIFKLRENTAAPSDDSRDTDEIVEIRSTKVAECRGGRELGDANVNFRVDSFVGGVVE
jgi:hypothetical protein